MNGGADVSATDFRTDYDGGSKAADDRNEIWTYYVVRPVSFHLAAVFIRVGITANQVTWLSFAVLSAGCALLGFGSYLAAVLGAGLINAWLLLDCVDGNIARYQKTSSTYGAFLDTIGGYGAYALVFLAAGIGAYNRPGDLGGVTFWSAGATVDGAVWMFLGAWASIAALWTRLVFQKFKNSFGGTELRRHHLIGASARQSWARRLIGVGNNVLNVSGGALVLLFAATLFGTLDLFLLLAALGTTAVLVLTFASLLRRAAAANS
jgi:phosphatidylglycerophosphate synthase